MDAQPKIGGFGRFKGVLQIPFFLLMQFHKAIFYFNPKMAPPAGHDTGRALSLFFLNFLSTSRRHRRSQQHRTSPLHSAIGTPIISCSDSTSKWTGRRR